MLWPAAAARADAGSIHAWRRSSYDRSVPPYLSDSVRPGGSEVDGVRFTERQARFLVHVLVFSGVFLERQYRAFTGIAHGQKTHDFLGKLVDGGYATPITPGALHRGRLFHVQYKPLYEAIGEPNNRHRKPASLGRFVERLMLLGCRPRRHALRVARHRAGQAGLLRRHARDRTCRRMVSASHVRRGRRKDARFFPDKLPIGVAAQGGRRHVFLYLATREVPADFRVFLLRHADLLKAVHEWTIRILVRADSGRPRRSIGTPSVTRS